MSIFAQTPSGKWFPLDLYGKYGISSFEEDFLPFSTSTEFVQRLQLKNFREWLEYCESGKKPNNIPSCPQYSYKKEWKGWGYFLGTNASRRIKNRKYVSINKAMEFAKSHNIKSFRSWIRYFKLNKKPKNIPYNPYTIYKGKGWTNWSDFLGTRIV